MEDLKSSDNSNVYDNTVKNNVNKSNNLNEPSSDSKLTQIQKELLNNIPKEIIKPQEPVQKTDHFYSKSLNVSSDSQEDTTSVSRIQAFIRGRNAKNAVFLPHQILPLIEQHLKGYAPEIHEDIARLICIELKEISKEPEKYKGQCIELKALSEAHIFKMPGEDAKKIDRPFSLYIKLDNEAKSFELLLVPEKDFSKLGKPLGEGAYKSIYRAQELNISRSLEKDVREFDYTPKVLVVLKVILDRDQNPVIDLRRGMKIHQELISSGEGKFAEVPCIMRPGVTEVDMGMNLKATWYNGDLEKLSASNCIPLDFTETSQTVPFTMQDKLNVIVDVAKSLDVMRRRYLVQRDLKPANILIKLDENNKPEGYLTDFDHAQRMGISQLETYYEYWDPLSRRGIVFPTTDSYGLVLTLGETLIPSFKRKDFNKYPQKILPETEFNQFKNLAVSEHFYTALQAFKDKEFEPLKQIFTLSYNKDTKTEELNAVFTPDKLMNKIDDFIQTYYSKLTPAQEQVLNQLTTEMNVIALSTDLIHRVIKQNAALEDRLVNEPDLVEQIKQNTIKNPEWTYSNDVTDEYLYSPYEIQYKIEELNKILAASH